MKKVTKFIAHDGREFDNEISCFHYEESLGFGDDEKANKYLKETYSGNELLRNHGLDDIGTWNILGEDPNADFVGNHTNPHLGYVCGTLYNAVKKAVRMDGFYTWGSGGKIIKITIEEV